MSRQAGGPVEADVPAEPSGVPTMFDVARRAGVSHQTVSRVLNGLTGVAASTKERVEQAIADLNYTPSPAARAMAKRRSGSIGLILAGRPDYGPSNAALGFNEAARDSGYTVSQASMRSIDADTLTQAVHRLVLQRVEAIVLISGERDGVAVVSGIDAGVPIVAVASEPAPPPEPAAAGRPGPHRVAIDQYAGARLATEHLIGLGHRAIRHVTGPADSMDAAERRRGWGDAMAEHGLEVRDPIEGDWLASSGHAAGQALIADPDATAVFVANDQMALGVLHACHAAGVDVPGNLSIVGFDDIPEAAYFTPALTTVRQDFDALGRDVMSTVLDVLGVPGDRGAAGDGGVPGHRGAAGVNGEHPAHERTTRVPELIVRATTAPPRA
ncbi:LacI family DNA-binding transcriptional regulator [Agromyces humatus]|uniref:LacI family DNA-binding transcriptional regulator n=1 Tax=Agromyces humatus TaxID=279573 RepID=UPI001E4CB70C|nr:LacI family DNA-binding transcriptional regulator [Agromyces humatus]